MGLTDETGETDAIRDAYHAAIRTIFDALFNALTVAEGDPEAIDQAMARARAGFKRAAVVRDLMDRIADER